MLETVLGVDPGGKGGETGIVLIEFGADSPARLVDSWAVKDDVDGFVDWWARQVGTWDWIVLEHFVNRNVRGADLTPCFVEGAVRGLARQDWGGNVILSPAGGKNTAVPDAAMKRIGLYIPGGHHRDRNEAARHVLWWLKRKRHIPTIQAMFPEEGK